MKVSNTTRGLEKLRFVVYGDKLGGAVPDFFFPRSFSSRQAARKVPRF